MLGDRLKGGGKPILERGLQLFLHDAAHFLQLFFVAFVEIPQVLVHFPPHGLYPVLAPRRRLRDPPLQIVRLFPLRAVNPVHRADEPFVLFGKAAPQLLSVSAFILFQQQHNQQYDRERAQRGGYDFKRHKSSFACASRLSFAFFAGSASARSISLSISAFTSAPEKPSAARSAPFTASSFGEKGTPCRFIAPKISVQRATAGSDGRIVLARRVIRLLQRHQIPKDIRIVADRPPHFALPHFSVQIEHVKRSQPRGMPADGARGFQAR